MFLKTSTLLEDNKTAEVKGMLGKLVPSYQSNSKIVDHIYEEQINFKNDVETASAVNGQEKKDIELTTE